MAEQSWIATEATITACRFQSPGLSTLAFGFSTRKRFSISFDYYAHGRLYSGEFQSDIAIPQNETIPITYNPVTPQQNSRAPAPPAATALTRLPQIVIGVAGSILISLLWLMILRGCR